MANEILYNTHIEKMILANLDGWSIGEHKLGGERVDPFMKYNESTPKANKIITGTECKLFFEEALDLAYMHTNRLNIDDLSKIEARVFVRGVCKWTASNLWNKYNIRVNNEDLEDTYIQSYGGLLYKSALKMLQPFVNQRIESITGLKGDSTDDVWLV